MLQSIRKDVIVSLITSFIVFAFINPISNFIFEILKNFFADYLDGAYSNASLGQRNWIDFLVYFMIHIVGFAILFDSFASSVRRRKRADKLRNERRKEREIKDSEELRRISKESIKDLETQIAQLDRRLKFYDWSFYITTFIGVITLIASVFSAYVDLQVNSSFNRSLNAIAPYISDYEEEVLKSKWALMKSRKDYVEINKILNDMGKRNKVSLPDVLFE
ncbi:hypothetical protein [Tellurirhabdus rosea]|uniref:hypothetical protein n=1 Tax=Tellurirhabdus rosea TaxID=2674997 RepID=UPI00224F8B66|nr:hypothetical protein [Tellurirhabdus rosea]